MGLLAIGIIALLATIVLPFAAGAATNRTGSDVKLGANERIIGDLNATGGSANIAGEVTGDANILAFNAKVSGTVQGSLNIGAGKVSVSGIVGRSARIAGGDVEITGRIDGDLVIAGGRVTIPSQAVIKGDVIVTGGQVDIRGTVDGDVRVTAEKVTIAGTIGGNTNISASSIDLLGPARLSGSLSYASPSSVDRAPAAVIQGTVDHRRPSSLTDGKRSFFNPWLRVIWALIAGVVVIGLAPRLMTAIAENGRKIMPSVGFGILGLILTPIVAFLLMISVIGLAIGVALLVIFLVTLYLSQVFVGMTIGRLILSGRWDDGSRGFNLLCMTIGVIIISALRFIPFPYVWGGVDVVVSIWGIGAAVMLLSRLRPPFARRQSAEIAAA